MKTILVVGLGRFGTAVARTLGELGHEVVVIDKDEAVVERVADLFPNACIGDAQNIEVLRSMAVSACDAAVVAIGADLAASVLTTMNLKELGVPYVICKARDRTYQRALERVGADEAMIPEQEMGDRLARRLGSDSILSYQELDDRYSIVEIIPPEKWQGKNVKELELERNQQMMVVGIRHPGGSLQMVPNPNQVIGKKDRLLMLGQSSAFSAFETV